MIIKTIFKSIFSGIHNNLSLVVFCIVLLSIPTTQILVKERQDLRQRAEFDNFNPQEYIPSDNPPVGCDVAGDCPSSPKKGPPLRNSTGTAAGGGGSGCGDVNNCYVNERGQAMVLGKGANYVPCANPAECAALHLPEAGSTYVAPAPPSDPRCGLVNNCIVENGQTKVLGKGGYFVPCANPAECAALHLPEAGSTYVTPPNQKFSCFGTGAGTVCNACDTDSYGCIYNIEQVISFGAEPRPKELPAASGQKPAPPIGKAPAGAPPRSGTEIPPSNLGENSNPIIPQNPNPNSETKVTVDGYGKISYCGDQVCSNDETASTCAQDCLNKTPIGGENKSAGFCGDAACNGDETAATCPSDCQKTAQPYCGDSVCSNGENSSTCAADCKPPVSCGNNVCESGETQATCAQDCPPALICGDNVCSGTESTATCPTDCKAPTPPPAPLTCGDKICSAEAGETTATCPSDCQLSPNSDYIALSVSIPGIGKNPGDTKDPKRPERQAQVLIFDKNNQQVKDTAGTLNFNGEKYTGNINVTGIPDGDYYIKIRLDNTLVKIIPGLHTIKKGSITNVAPVILTPGDSNQNNVFDLFDYNLLVDCMTNQNCETKIQADLNDDGIVDVIDLNILVSRFVLRNGDSGTEGNTPSLTPNPIATPSPAVSGNTCTACQADLNKDGTVTITDFNLFTSKTGFSCLLPAPGSSQSQCFQERNCILQQIGKTCNTNGGGN